MVVLEVNVDGLISLERQYEWFVANNPFFKNGHTIVHSVIELHLLLGLDSDGDVKLLPKVLRDKYGHVCFDAGRCGETVNTSILRIGDGNYSVCGVNPIGDYTEFIDVQLPIKLEDIHTTLIAFRNLVHCPISWKSSNLF